MTSAIDASKPITGTPTTESVRANFAAAKSEIEALQSAIAALGVGTLATVRRGSAAMQIAGAANCTALGTLALVALRCYLIPFTVSQPVHLSQLMLSVTVLGASTASLGIYANDPSGDADNPGTLLAQGAAAIDLSSVGDKYAALSLDLEPGVIYWGALVASVAATVRCLTVAARQTNMGRTAGSTAALTHLYYAMSNITLLPTMPPCLQGTGSCPALYLYQP